MAHRTHTGLDLDRIADPRAADPLDAVLAAEAWGYDEPRPAWLVGMTIWGANPAVAAGYRGGPCPHGPDAPARRSICVICHATATRPRGVPMQRIRRARGEHGKTRRERRRADR